MNCSANYLHVNTNFSMSWSVLPMNTCTCRAMKHAVNWWFFWQILIVFLLYKKTYFSCVFMRGSFLFCSASLWLCICTKLYFCTYVDLLVSSKCNRNWAHEEFNLQTPYLVLTEKISSQSWFWKVCQTESVGVAIYCFCALRLKSILRCK